MMIKLVTVTCLLASVTIAASFGLQSQIQRDLSSFDDTRMYHGGMEDEEAYKTGNEDFEEEEYNYHPFIHKRSSVTPITKFMDNALLSHNSARKRHGVQPLTYNKLLESHAIAYAKKLAATNTFNHDGNELTNYGEGENLFKGYSNQPIDICEASFDWYNEIKFFDWSQLATAYNFRPIPPQLGHFTQMIWAKTREVGCGGAYVQSNQPSLGRYLTYIVCRYNPPGNGPLQFTESVRPLLPGAPAYFRDYNDVCLQTSCSDKKSSCASKKADCTKAFFVGEEARANCPKTCGLC